MTADELIALAQLARTRSPCARCQALVCKGWESIPGGFDTAQLQRVGSLRDPHDEDPTLQEYHPAGTSGWSAEAPIALGWSPYNRCDVWQCASCLRPFLRYTEYGGYYTDERVRELQASLIVASP
ncbi:hypothetical protein [Hydrogenophaga sp. BPS33]|uniref:hypothetical protein n=1 Tax=Hydrogenophaga sp. BPS33 TaxID=2651974 RepID=UPI001F17C8EB|nr:hypothetical protein [Hydrogenophaga sp. BPS33]